MLIFNLNLIEETTLKLGLVDRFLFGTGLSEPVSFTNRFIESVPFFYETGLPALTKTDLISRFNQR